MAQSGNTAMLITQLISFCDKYREDPKRKSRNQETAALKVNLILLQMMPIENQESHLLYLVKHNLDRYFYTDTYDDNGNKFYGPSDWNTRYSTFYKILHDIQETLRPTRRISIVRIDAPYEPADVLSINPIEANNWKQGLNKAIFSIEQPCEFFYKNFIGKYEQQEAAAVLIEGLLAHQCIKYEDKNSKNVINELVQDLKTFCELYNYLRPAGYSGFFGGSTDHKKVSLFKSALINLEYLDETQKQQTLAKLVLNYLDTYGQLYPESSPRFAKALNHAAVTLINLKKPQNRATYLGALEPEITTRPSLPSDESVTHIVKYKLIGREQIEPASLTAQTRPAGTWSFLSRFKFSDRRHASQHSSRDTNRYSGQNIKRVSQEDLTPL